MDEERRARSPLVNALWGAGISYGTVDDATQARMRRVLAVFTVACAVVVGVAVGILQSAVWGAIAAVAALLVLGVTARATLNDWQ